MWGEDMIISEAKDMRRNVLFGDVRCNRQPQMGLSIRFDIIAHVIRAKDFVFVSERVVDSDVIRGIDDGKCPCGVVVVDKTR